MKLLQEDLNRARKGLADKHGATYTAPYHHPRPRDAAVDVCAPCGDAKDASGQSLDHRRLRSRPSDILIHIILAPKNS